MNCRCSFVDCAKPSAVTLETHEYCILYFISTCYQRLENSPEDTSLLEIVERATAIGLTAGNLTNQERIQIAGHTPLGEQPNPAKTARLVVKSVAG
jgi:hypothetical protein